MEISGYPRPCEQNKNSTPTKKFNKSCFMDQWELFGQKQGCMLTVITMQWFVLQNWSFANRWKTVQNMNNGLFIKTHVKIKWYPAKAPGLLTKRVITWFFLHNKYVFRYTNNICRLELIIWACFSTSNDT